MPAIPAATIHSHRTLDAAPLHLQEETYILLQKARIAASSESVQRFVDLNGACFLRVDSDQRLQYAIDFAVLEIDGLANYYPGRALSERAIAFATGDTIPHQFSDDGIFIYESVTSDDSPGELRTGTVNISYDLHGLLDLTTYPVTVPAPPTYSDVPVQAAQEISNTTKNLLLEDIFYGESNLDAAFTVACYNGDPAGAGTLVVSATLTDPWTDTTNNISPYTWNDWGIRNPEIVYNSTGSSRTVTHLRLARGSNVICDIALAATLTIPAGNTLRIPAQALTISLHYYSDGASGLSDDSESPARHFLGYVCGGTRFTHFPEACFDLELYESDPGGDASILPVDSFRVDATSTYWTVTTRTVAPALAIAGTALAPTGGWNITCVILKLCNLPVWAIKEIYSATVAADAAWSDATSPAVDIDDT